MFSLLLDSHTMESYADPKTVDKHSRKLSGAKVLCHSVNLDDFIKSSNDLMIISPSNVSAGQNTGPSHLLIHSVTQQPKVKDKSWEV